MGATKDKSNCNYLFNYFWLSLALEVLQIAEKKRPLGRFGTVYAEKLLDAGTPSGRW